ncbi:MAG: hypothetical protein H6772_01875 [Pseudomonadales bacterium]|nr:hypothetical protein [Pseudomonadales bacterium]
MKSEYIINLLGSDNLLGYNDRKELVDATRENSDAIIAQRKAILELFKSENADPRLVQAVTIAREKVQLQLDALGLSSITIPELLLIDWEHQEEISRMFETLGGGNYINLDANTSIYNGVSIVFLQKSLSVLDQARIIYRVTLESIGERVITATRNEAREVRIGLQVVNATNTFSPWLLEKGISSYESTQFLLDLTKDPAYKTEVNENETVYQNNSILSEGTIHFASRVDAPTRYSHIENRDNNERMVSLSLQNYAGSVFELLLSEIPEEEQTNFLELALKARIDLKLIPQLAKMIDSYWGKGTYCDFLRCPDSWEGVKNIADSLKEKKHYLTRLRTYESKLREATSTESRRALLSEIKSELQDIDTDRVITLRRNYDHYLTSKTRSYWKSSPSKIEASFVEALHTMFKKIMEEDTQGDLENPTIQIRMRERRVDGGSLMDLKVGVKNEIIVEISVLDTIWPYDDTEQKLYVLLNHFGNYSIGVTSTASSIASGQTENMPEMNLSMLRKWDAFSFAITPLEANQEISVVYSLINSSGMLVCQGDVKMKSEA